VDVGEVMEMEGLCGFENSVSVGYFKRDKKCD
jgi:hypothetical protein